MKRLVGIFAILVLASACDVGGADDGDDGDDGPEDRITCMAELSVTGTFAMSAPQPIDVQGCWPVGTWTFSTAVVSNDCTPAPTLLPSYQFRVDRDTTAAEPDLTWIYTAVTPSDPTADVSVTSGGGGLCSGHFNIYSADGLTVWNLTPALQLGGAINGNGMYEVHTLDQRPEPAGP